MGRRTSPTPPPTHITQLRIVRFHEKIGLSAGEEGEVFASSFSGWLC